MEIIEDSILIGYVCGGTLEREFLPTILNLMASDSMQRRQIIGLKEQPGLYIDDNRNTLTRAFLQTPAEWMLSLDTDIVDVPLELVYALFDTAKKRDFKILSALYFGFDAKGLLRPVWFEKSLKTLGGIAWAGLLKAGEPLKKLEAVGMGCCLIHRSVFEAMDEVPEWHDDAWTFFSREQCVVDGKPIRDGEDIGFSRRANKLGFEIWGHRGLVVGHKKAMVIDHELFKILYDANWKGVRDV